MELTLVQAIPLILIGFGGGFAQRVSGFGLGIFTMVCSPLLPLETAAVAAMSGICSLGTATRNAYRYRRSAELKTIAPLILAALVTIPLAVKAAASVPQRTMTAILGVVLILLSIYFLRFSKRIHIKATVGTGLLIGTVGGVLSGLFSTGGPPVVLYLAGATNDKLAYFATIQLYFSIINMYSTANRIINGILTKEVFLWAAVMLIGCLMGNMVGTKVFQRLDGDRIKQIIYIGMIISGIFMIL